MGKREGEHRVLVTGSRDWPLPLVVANALNIEWMLATERGEHVVVMQGECPTGADYQARAWTRTAERQGLTVALEGYKADWERHGRAAGPKRNKVMVEQGPDVCLAFNYNNSKGTGGCVGLAQLAGIPVHLWELEGVG